MSENASDNRKCLNCAGNGSCPDCSGSGLSEKTYCPTCKAVGNCQLCGGSGHRPHVELEIIQKRVAAFYQIELKDLTGRKRSARCVVPRHVAMYLARELTTYSFPEIGYAFGGKHHSSVMHACNKITTSTDKQLKVDVETLRTAIELIGIKSTTTNERRHK